MTFETYDPEKQEPNTLPVATPEGRKEVGARAVKIALDASEAYRGELRASRAVTPIPQRLDDAPPAPFPLNALPDPLRAMVEHAALQTSAPVSLCAAAGLGALAASIGSGLFVQSAPAALTPANLFLLCFAQSGTGKGRAFDVMLAAFNTEAYRRATEWDATERPNIAADLQAASVDLDKGRTARKSARTPEAQAEALEAIRDATRRAQEAEAALARRPVFNCGNATLEAITETLANAPGEAAAIISSEGRDCVDNLLGRYSKSGKGSDEAIYLQSYSGDPVTHSRKGKPLVSLRSPRLTLCLAVQPDIWARLAADGRMMESGFLARSLTFDAKAPPVRPSSHIIPLTVSAAWGARIAELLDLRDAPEPRCVITPTHEARDIIDALANEAADAREAGGKWFASQPFAARLAENAWRLACVLHAAEHGGQAQGRALTAGTARDAVALARWFFTETLGLLAPTRALRQAARLEALLKVFESKAVVELPTWVLGNSHGFQEAELKELAAGFPARFRIVRGKSGPQGGRAAETGQVRPFPAAA